MKSNAMTQLQHWASLWSALVHDFEHGGLNNDFLIKSRNPLAITYNDQSPLENHHIAAATRLLSDPELCYLQVSPAASLPASSFPAPPASLPCPALPSLALPCSAQSCLAYPGLA